MRTKTCTLLFTLLAATASSLASADALVTVKTETVRYDDIRLISNVGAAVLYGRLRTAAERACGGPVEGVAQLAAKQRYNACFNEAMARAVDQVNHPMLTQYYESKRNAIVSGPPKDASVTAAK